MAAKLTNEFYYLCATQEALQLDYRCEQHEMRTIGWRSCACACVAAAAITFEVADHRCCTACGVVKKYAFNFSACPLLFTLFAQSSEIHK